MLVISLCILMLSTSSNGNIVDIDSNNLESVLSGHEVVFVNFYAEWCRFSRMLTPIFEQAANDAKTIFPEPGTVALARVDCDKHPDIAKKYSVNKYPTMKLFRNGQLMKREYRGQRTSEALLEFVKEQLKDPIKIFQTVEEMESLETTKRTIIAYLTSKDSQEYGIYEKIAKALKDDCDFYAGFGDVSHKERQTGDNIIFKPSNEEPEMVYLSSLKNHDMLKAWATDKCIPLVREITFKNGEELTEEGRPFLILFHRKEDTESLDIYRKVISRDLLDEKSSINFLEADCETFSHPLQHLGKSSKECPLIAIDSFKHMYLFPSFSDLTIPNKLKEFIKDLHSGKLHREFHHGPDSSETPKPTEATEPPTIAPELKEELKKKGMDVEKIEKQAQEYHKKQAEEAAANQTPPPVSTSVKSIFKNLKPSEHRYTILDRVRDEL